MEFNAIQSLQGLGRWAQHFRVFVNGTKLRLEGDKAADFTRYLWALSFAMTGIPASTPASSKRTRQRI